MSLKANTKLTQEQETYWKTLLIRASDNTVGQPELAYVFFKMTPINVPGLKTMGIDKRLRVYIDFDYFMSEKDVVYASGVLNHEPWHWLLRHAERFENLDVLDNGHEHNSMAWNHAGDLAINEPLRPLGKGGKVPDDGLFPGQGPYEDFPSNESSEHYYGLIMKALDDVCPDCGAPISEDQKNQNKDKQDQDDSSDNQQNGDENADADADGNSDENQNDGQDGDESGDDGQNGDCQGQGDAEDGQGQGGSGGQDGQDGQDGQGQDGQGNGQGQGSGDGQGNGQGGSGSQDGQDGQDGQGHGGKSSNHECKSCGSPQNGGQGSLNGQSANCGSGAGGVKGEYELDADDADAPGVDPDDAEVIRKQVAQEIIKRERSMPGSVPGTMKLWADAELAAEPVDWRKVLRGMVRGASNQWTRGKMDYNRKRPNRRQPANGIIYPSLMAPKPRIGVGIDTSGSHLHKLGIVIDQLVEITKQLGVRGRDLLAFGVDVNVGETQIVNNPHTLLDNMVGGGGTDMGVGIEQLHKLRMEKKIDIAILVSDLQTGWPKQRPDDNMRYIVCGIVDGSSWEQEWVERAEKEIGSWADIVVIDIDDTKRKKKG